MKKPSRIIPQKALDAQTRSSHPQTSVWVSANAGSGKTHVLTERVIRILLSGTDPSRILCLTYTKAAAAVMQTRIFNRLSEWTRASDEELKDALYKLEHRHADQVRLNTARKLFARALETPGGLKIQTIHAFCEALLHQFPVEANIAGHFDMIDDMQQRALVGAARRTILETAYLDPQSPLGQAFTQILATVGEDGLDRLFEEAIAKRQILKPSLQRWAHEGADLFYKLLGVKPHDTIESLSYNLKQAALYSPDRLALFLAHGGSTTAEFIERVKLLSAEKDWKKFSRLASDIYFTGAGKARSASRIFVKNLAEKVPDAIDEFHGKLEDVLNLADQIRAIKVVDMNKAAYTMMAALTSCYEELKRGRSFLDFDDLIYRTLALLKRKGAGQWVQYKLDRGIDHILVDEAQDTSPAQWEIIRLLSGEFFSGLGARDVERTIFAVGDEKQSIYSFQGAKPEDFAKNGRDVKRLADEARKPFKKERLDFSFRSTRDVLSAVDLVFSTPENYQGLSAENEATVHDAVRVNEPGEVDIWEALTPEVIEEPEDWREPVDHLAAPAIRLAGQIGETIHNWLKNGEVIAGQERLLRPSDVMVLVRKRDQFVHALSRELKKLGVAVAGADRLRLTDHIAVRDLMALGRFVLQPHDNLSLAAILKSPLFGFSEQELFDLAAKRNNLLLFALEDAAKDPNQSPNQSNEKIIATYKALQTYRALADITPVYEFYSRILSEDGGRRKLLARLGAEASDVLDAFMDYTLAIQRTGLPGLQAFLETLAEVEPEIKRELDQNRDEVRIMTVHAAKGLEAAVVFLVDSGSRIWNAQHEPKLVRVIDETVDKGFEHDRQVILWQPGADYRTVLGQDAIDALKQRSEEEYRRLLYVGMTRAEDRLIVCGYRGRNQVKGTWLDLVSNALSVAAKPLEPAPAEGVIAQRYQITPPQLAIHEKEPEPEMPDALPPAPAFLFEKAPSEKALPRPLTPSGASVTIEDAPEQDPDHLRRSPVLGLESTTRGSSFAIERGNIIHALLQFLPDVPHDARRDLAQGFLARQAKSWSASERDEAEHSVFAILEGEGFQPLFTGQSRAEVALMGVVEIGGKKRAVSGQIDRLAISDDKIWLADFKTGHIPQDAAEIPAAYLLQMALYAKLLQQLYPQKIVCPMLIYTRAPRIFELPDRVLENILDKLAKKSADG